MSPPHFTIRVGHVIVHTHSETDLGSAIQRLCPLPERDGDSLLPRLAAYSAGLLQAASSAAPKNIRCLRDVALLLKGMAPRDEVRIVEQSNAAYSLLRHVSKTELDSLVESIVARLLTAGPTSSAAPAARPADPLVAEDSWAQAASILRPCRSGPNGQKALSEATEVAQLSDRMRSAEFSLDAVERRAEETNKNACALGEQLKLFQVEVEERVREIREI